MHVETYGDGPRVYLALHGWGGSHRDFAPVAARMPPDARLLSVDLPGYGYTPPPARWHLDEITGAIVRVIETSGAKTLTLVGFCSGAVLALLAAQRIPTRIRRIVMIDPFAFVPWYFRMFTAGALGRLAYRATFASRFGRRVTTAILRRMQSTDDDFLAAFTRVDHDVTLRWMALFRTAGPVQRFADITAPIHIAIGEKTFAAVRTSVREYMDLWPAVRLTELARTGHLPLVRGARQLSEIIFEP